MSDRNHILHRENVKKTLDNLSPSLCAAKWDQTTVHLHNGLTHSCHHPKMHAIDRKELAENYKSINNTDFKINQRRMMAEGIRPPDCDYCWRIEDNGHMSDRIMKSAEPWADQTIELWNEHGTDYIKDHLGKDVMPKYLEVSFSNVCNFKCSYCGPVVSSRWQEEIQTLGPYSTRYQYGNMNDMINQMPIPNREQNPYIDAFWQWWPELHQNLWMLRITGGEPLLSKHTFKVLDYFVDHPNTNMRLSINSNFGVDIAFVKKLAKKVQQIHNQIHSFGLYVSIDSLNKDQIEYSRDGLDLEVFMANVEYWLENAPQGSVFHIMNTVNILSIGGMLELTQWVHELRKRYWQKVRIGMDTPYLRYPDFLSVALCDQEQIDIMKQSLDYMKANGYIGPDGKIITMNEYNVKTRFTDLEIRRLDRVISWAESEMHRDHTEAKIDALSFFEQYDQRRNKNFDLTFDYLVDWKNRIIDNLLS